MQTFAKQTVEIPMLVHGFLNRSRYAIQLSMAFVLSWQSSDAQTQVSRVVAPNTIFNRGNYHDC